MPRPEFSRSSPALCLVDDCLDMVWRSAGSDLLFMSGSPPLARVDGQLRPVPDQARLDPEVTRMVAEELMGPELLARFDEAGEIDFSFTWRDQARLRGNAYTQRGLVSIALRIIPRQVPQIHQLGLPEIVHQWVNLPVGFVLVTGPTGSGKSTTLAALVDHINTHRPQHIVTIEDPVEYVHDNKLGAVSQREVGSDTRSFASALRAVLREDPDVVLIGEMRDPESIQAALTISETGHLVFATLHTNNTAQTLDRIIDVFEAERQPQIRLQLAHTLAGVLHQVLVRRRGGGRVAAFDVLVGTHAVRNLIREGKTRQIRNVVSTGQREGMQTLEASLNLLVAQGVIDFEDALSASSYPDQIVRPMPVLPAGVTTLDVRLPADVRGR